MTFTSFLVFLTSYFETLPLFNVSQLLIVIQFWALVILTIVIIYTSSKLERVITGDETSHGKCLFIMPQFNQEHLMEHGCPAKYTSFADKIDSLECRRVEISRIWEDNINMLVADQKQEFGCLNSACCNQVNEIIKFRLASLTSFLVMCSVFQILLMVTTQTMNRKIRKYRARLLNHSGDCFNLVTILFVAISFAAAVAFVKFDQIGHGRPVVGFKGLTSLFIQDSLQIGQTTKFNLRMGTKKTPVSRSIVEMEGSSYNHFVFSDVDKILPAKDNACLRDGICREDGIVLI